MNASIDFSPSINSSSNEKPQNDHSQQGMLFHLEKSAILQIIGTLIVFNNTKISSFIIKTFRVIRGEDPKAMFTNNFWADAFDFILPSGATSMFH